MSFGQWSPQKVGKPQPDDAPGILYVGDKGKELLTKLQVALAFGKTERTINNWMRLGYIKYVKISDQSVMFRREHVMEALDRFLRNGELGPRFYSNQKEVDSDIEMQ